jgi:PAS domain S-box-containing protein
MVVDCETLRVARVNTVFSQDIMELPDINDLLLKTIVKDTDIESVCNALASSNDMATGFKECKCSFIRLSKDNAFPEYLPVLLRFWREQSSYVVHVLLDAQAHHRMERSAPDAHKETMSDYLENAPIGLQWLSSTGHVLWANKTQLNFLGYSPEEFVGKHITDFSTDSQETLHANFDIVNKGGTLTNLSSTWKTKCGDLRNVMIDSNVRFGAEGQVLNTRCFIRDDTAVQLQRLRSQLEAENALNGLKSKDRFLRKVLHEIRTPASIILQSLDVSREEDVPHIKQVEKLVRIIKDVEDADSFESGQVLVQEKDRFCLLDLVYDTFESIAEEYAVDAVNRRVLFDTEWVPLEIVMDRKCFKRVLSHLYENALRFTQSGSVDMHIAFNGDILTISICNTGDALDVDSMFKVFDHYWQGGDAMFTSAGIGLGLNICYHVLQHMGSALKVESKGGVNTFSFDLKPYILSTTRPSAYARSATTHEVLAPPVPQKRTSILEPSSWVDLEESEQIREHVAMTDTALEVEPVCAANTCALASLQAPKRPHILVVDDNVLALRMLSRTLQKLDCTTETASNGKIACEMALAKEFSLILMDLRMPVRSGIEAAIILSQENKIKTPIVAFSADSTQQIRDECAKAGMVSFTAKPISSSDMRLCIQSFVHL